MSKYVVDTEVIDDAVQQLVKLKSQCSDYATRKIPESEDDIGKTHKQVVAVMNSVLNTWSKFEELIDKTVQFLGKESETVLINDKNSSKKIQQ